MAFSFSVLSDDLGFSMPDWSSCQAEMRNGDENRIAALTVLPWRFSRFFRRSSSCSRSFWSRYYAGVSEVNT